MTKIPEKLDILNRIDFGLPKERYLKIFLPESSNEHRLAEKLNEIIDYLNEKVYKQRVIKRTIPTKEVSTKNKE